MARYGGRAFSIGMNSGGFLKALNRFEASIEQKYKRALVRFAVHVNERLLARTPVWEGTTLRNWQWSLRSPKKSVKKPEGGGIPPGPTNTMALGAEPRRAANEDAQRADFQMFLSELLAQPKVPNIYLTNPAPNAMGVEYGMLPSAERSRTPAGGVVRLAVYEALAAMSR